MKRIALMAMTALIALAATVVPASAITVKSIQKYTAKVTPNKGGTKKKPRPIKLVANPYFDDISADLNDGVQFATVNANVQATDNDRSFFIFRLLSGIYGSPAMQTSP